MADVGNKNIVLIVGRPSSGKTASLRNIASHSSIAYLNTDLKEIPFKSKMAELYIKQPEEIFGAIHEIENTPECNMGVLDTLSFLMGQYETQRVLTATNGQKA